MKVNKKYLMIILWILIIYILGKIGVITFNIDAVKEFVMENKTYSIAMFLGLWIVRLFIFLPGVTLMISGGICFGPWNGFLLSMLGITLSESLIFVLTKIFSDSKFKNSLLNKYPDMVPLIKTYRYKFLVLGIICPVAPTDVVCMLAACIGMEYSRYITTVFLANLPIVGIYSGLGIVDVNSSYSITMIVLTISLITFYSVRIWYKMRRKVMAN